MTRLLIVLGAAAAAAAAVPAGVTSSPSQAPARIVDRTVSCAIKGVGFPDPARYLSVSASPHQGGPGGYGPSLSAHEDGELTIALGRSSNPGDEQGYVVVNRSRCSATTAHVRLSRGSLPGGRTELGERWRCEMPARFLIRIRAEFARPVRLRSDPRARHQLFANGKLVGGSLTVTTLRRGPIYLGAADVATGRARIFVDRSRCSEL